MRAFGTRHQLAWRLASSASRVVKFGFTNNHFSQGKHTMIRTIIVGILAVLLSGCAGMQLGPNTTTGIGVGAIGGAILNRDNPAAGAIIGGTIGGLIGNVGDQQNGYPQNNYPRGGYDNRCNHGCGNNSDWQRRQEWERRQEIRRQQIEQQRWEQYCRQNWRMDRRCR